MQFIVGGEKKTYIFISLVVIWNLQYYDDVPDKGDLVSSPRVPQIEPWKYLQGAGFWKETDFLAHLCFKNDVLDA